MNDVSLFRMFYRSRVSALIGAMMLMLFLLSACSSTPTEPAAVRLEEQFSVRNGMTPSDDGENRDEEHGLALELHHDENRNVRDDLYRKSIALVRELSVDGSAQWTQIGPAPAAVNQYLAGNGQMPGPNTGAVMDIVIDPSGTTDQTVYAVSNDGGVWKTSDGGVTWLPKTDSLSTLSFGAIALDPSHANIIYAGTGNIFNNGYFKGMGVYQSTDSGDTWTLTAGSATLNGIGINKMLVPGSNVLLVATQSGMYRSIDQGKTYTQIAIGGNLGLYITDLDMNAGTTHPIWASVQGKGIYVSTDQGATFTSNLWRTTDTGAPAQNTYHFVSLGVSADGNTMYANASQYNNKALGVWKSTDGGGHWTDITANALNPANATKNNHTIPDWRQIKNCQCGYDQTLGVDPQDANRVYMGFQDLWLSEDGGTTWTDVTYDATYTTEQMHVDHHALVFSPASHRVSGEPIRIWVGNDGGIWYSNNEGDSWVNRNASIASNLFRGIDTGRGLGNNGWTYGGMQDTGTAVGKPGLPANQWTEFGGGDGGKAAVDPTNPEYAYGMWGNIMGTHDGGVTLLWSTISCDSGWSAGNYTDLAVDSQRRVYASGLCQQTGQPSRYSLFRSNNYGVNFTHFFQVSQNIADIALSPADTNIVWLSLSNGTVTKVTINTEGVPTSTNYTIPNAIQWQSPRLAVDQTDANQVVAVFPGYSGQSLPSRHVFLTRDGGVTWKDISGGHSQQSVPDMPVYSAAFDTNTLPHSIIVSTDMGVLRTLDYGNRWHQLGVGLPNVHTVSLAIDTTVNPSILKVGTYGRSTWQTTLSETMIRPLSDKLLQLGNITWTNQSSEPVALSWMDMQGNEVSMGSLAAGASNTWGPAYFVGVNVVRDQEGNIVLVYIINGNQNQAVSISTQAVAAAKLNALKVMPGLRSLPGGIGVSNFNVHNNSSITLDLNYIDTNGVPQRIGQLSAGGSTTVIHVYFGGLFTLNDPTGIVAAFVATDALSQAFTVTDALVNFWK